MLPWRFVRTYLKSYRKHCNMTFNILVHCSSPCVWMYECYLVLLSIKSVKSYLSKHIKKYGDRECYCIYNLWVQWVPDCPNPDYPNTWLSECLDLAMFLAAAGKRLSSHWSFATGESKAVRLFRNATTPFSVSTGFRSRFITSELAERSRRCCSTLYHSVANQEAV